MFKKLVSVLAVLGLMLSLCGCDLFTADTAELLSPPSLSGDLKYISQAIKQSAGDGYTLKYPSRGSYRSAVVQQDIPPQKIVDVLPHDIHFARRKIGVGEVTVRLWYSKTSTTAVKMKPLLFTAQLMVTLLQCTSMLFINLAKNGCRQGNSVLSQVVLIKSSFAI